MVKFQEMLKNDCFLTQWNTVWLRTRHTDHHASKSSFNAVRDVVKADIITKNPPAAKYALTEMLNMCYTMDESSYYR